MKATKENIKASILFLFGLVVLLFVSSWLFQPKRNTESHGMEDWRANGILAEPKDTLDVVFIGDSVSYCSINPLHIWRDYGITSYVCATSEQMLYYSKEFLYKTFENQSPKVIMLGTSAIFNHFSYKDEVRNLAEQALPVFRYHDRWKQAGTFPELSTGMLVDYSYRQSDKGYYFSSGKLAADAEGYAAPVADKEWVPEINRRILREIKAYCDKQNAELILLSEPNAAGSWSPLRHNASVELAEELGVTYIDINHMPEEVPIDWTEDTFDAGDHLNIYGAAKVSAYLGQYLTDRGIFTDKRTNEAYDFWNEAEKAFYESIKDWM